MFWALGFFLPVTGTHTRRAFVWTCCEMVIISPLLSSSPWWRSGMPCGRPRKLGPFCGCRDRWKSSLISWITSTTTWPGLRQLKGKVSQGTVGSSAAGTGTVSLFRWGTFPECFVHELETLRHLNTIHSRPLSIFMENVRGNVESQGCPDPGASCWCHSKPGRQCIAPDHISRVFQCVKIFCIEYKSFHSFKNIYSLNTDFYWWDTFKENYNLKIVLIF